MAALTNVKVFGKVKFLELNCSATVEKIQNLIFIVELTLVDKRAPTFVVITVEKLQPVNLIER